MLTRTAVSLQASVPSVAALQACRHLVDQPHAIADRSPSSPLQRMRQALLEAARFKPKGAGEGRSFVSDLIEVEEMLTFAGMKSFVPTQSQSLMKLARLDADRHRDSRKETQIVQALNDIGLPGEVVYTSPRLSHIKLKWMKGAFAIPHEGCDEESLQRYARRIAETEVCKVAILDKWDTAANQRHYLKKALVALQRSGPTVEFADRKLGTVGVDSTCLVAMADIRPDGPPREGVRGGLEQFKWDDIKNISYKDREQYLGYSTRLGQLGKFGRWNRNDWWRKERRGAKQIEDERTSVQQYENEIMLEALGQKPKRLLLMRNDNLTPEQLAAIARGDNPDKPKDADGNVKDENALGPGDDEYETQKLIDEANAKKGMGYNPYAKQADQLYGKSNTTVLGEDGVTREVVKIDDDVKKEDEDEEGNREEWEYRPPSKRVLGPVMPGRDGIKEEREEEEEDPRDAKARRKAEKKLAKKIKKDKKKADKERKKEERRKRSDSRERSRRRRSRSRSPHRREDTYRDDRESRHHHHHHHRDRDGDRRRYD
ncbi:hypothetical protein FOL47_000052 [Perkinsus chesapeaki]|uniref:Multiple myeloma tumor-associated protein 2-like N-terminal domain-containing protein n=1 Tax=Perkinsus chesapeaki TaxID=330153 RepID=A0A7J6N375_PERCH|nr:hypothetical protein FOL47_000052 [Perkinsus chesapeaki]